MDDAYIVLVKEYLWKFFALKKLLAKPSISFPVIIIDGIFHGGSDDVVDNSDTIINIIAKELKCDDKKALEYLKMLKKEKRYLLDVY